MSISNARSWMILDIFENLVFKNNKRFNRHNIQFIHNKKWLFSVCAAPSFTIWLIVKIPGIGHHELKVGIVINACAEFAVVLSELLLRNASVTLSLVNRATVDFKCVQKFCENLLLCLVARLHIWVHSCIINTLQITDIDCSGTISIHLLEGSNDKILSKLVQIWCNCI